MSDSASHSLGRFGLLASAIAGRAVEVRAADPTDPPWTDGAAIYVEPHAPAREQARSAVVQAALLHAGSLDPVVLGRLARRSGLARRYLAVEGHRALAALEELLPPAVRSVIDREVAARSDSPISSLAIATSRARLTDPPECFGVLKPRRVRAPEPVTSDAPATRHVPRSDHQEVAELDDDTTDDDIVVDFLSSPVGGGGPIGRLLQRLMEEARSAGAGPPGVDTSTRWSRRADRVARGAAVTTAIAPTPDGGEAGEVPGFTYPEWDVHRRTYRADWCTVVERDPNAEGGAPIVSAHVHALRRPLARLGTELERRRRQLQGDDLDIDATVERHVEVLAGTEPDDAVYIDSVRRRRDLSVLVLLDVSGSSGEPSLSGGSVHDEQCTAASALVQALEDLGDRVALYAFRSMGRSDVHLLPVKRFDATFGADALGRLGALVPGAYTRLGAAIRHGASVLEHQGGTARPLLVVLSDGFAYDHGYAGTYGEADARRALAEARRRGTGCLCLSIGATTDADALRRVFGTAAHARIPQVGRMAAVVGPLFRSAIRSAEVRRRASQRTERTTERLHIEGSVA